MATIDDIVRTIFGRSFSISRGYSSGHDGVDISAPEGTPVYALESGIVGYARDARRQADQGESAWARGGGNVVNINIGNSVYTQYAHLRDISVREGQQIKKGDLIGHVGSTGNASGPHLHFGILDRNTSRMLNPVNWLNNRGVDIGPMHFGPGWPFNTGPGPQDPADASNAVDTLFNRLNIPTARGHIITQDEAGRLATESGIRPGSSIWTQFRDSFTGKTVQQYIDQLASGQSESLDNPLDVVPDIAGAISGFGDLIGKLAGFAAGMVLIILGIFLYSKTLRSNIATVGKIGATGI